MSECTATKAAQRVLEHCLQHSKDRASIVFHGGEPLLGGLKHLDRLTSIIATTFSGSGVRLSVGMQSNGLLFTPDVGDLLLARNFSIGISLDGPPRVNDKHRVDHLGRASTLDLEPRLRMLTAPRYHSIFGGFLSVIDPTSNPRDVLDYLLSFDPPQIDFLFPLNNHDNLPVGKRENPTATPFGDWLIGAYDHWLTRETSTRIRIFESIIGMLGGIPTMVESLGLLPVDLVVIETDGQIEAVDSLKASAEGATYLGYNIFDHSFDLVAMDAAVQMRQVGATSLCKTCRECPVVNVCGGGYLPHRYSRARAFSNPSVYCDDLQKLIGHVHSSVSAHLADLYQVSTPLC